QIDNCRLTTRFPLRTKKWQWIDGHSARPSRLATCVDNSGLTGRQAEGIAKAKWAGIWGGLNRIDRARVQTLKLGGPRPSAIAHEMGIRLFATTIHKSQGLGVTGRRHPRRTHTMPCSSATGGPEERALQIKMVAGALICCRSREPGSPASVPDPSSI